MTTCVFYQCAPLSLSLSLSHPPQPTPPTQKTHRGSTGFGEVSVQSLPGNIGTHDVEDCRAALAAAAAAGYCDPTRLGIVGGSHGGFLAASLVGQYPDEFAAAVLRNPVCDLSAMVHITDITDWVFIEAWGSVEGMARVSQQPTGEDMERFRAVSPVKHVGRIKAAMLFLLGAKDERYVRVDQVGGLIIKAVMMVVGIGTRLCVCRHTMHTHTMQYTHTMHIV